MRKRTKTTTTRMSFGQYYKNSAVNVYSKTWGVPGDYTKQGPPFSGTGDLATKVETMYDSASGFGKQNACLHLKRSIISADYLIDRRLGSPTRTDNVILNAPGSPKLWIVFNPLWALQPQSLVQPDMESALLPHPTSLMSGLALRTMWPEVESELSLINFIVELKDLKTLPKTVKSLKRLWKTMSGKRDASRAVRDISDVFLQHEYGVKPLGRDIESLLSVIVELESRMREYFSHTGKKLVRHYTTEYTPEVLPWLKTQSFYLPSTPSDWLGTHKISVSPVKYTATMQYSYSVPGVDPTSAHARELFLKDLLGIRMDPRIVWDALPYSFIIDYFVKVGDFLEKYKVRQIEPSVVIWSFMETIRYTKTRDTTVIPWQTVTENGDRPVGTTILEVYSRKNVVPNTYESLQVTGLSTRQIINLAALAGSQSSKTAAR